MKKTVLALVLATSAGSVLAADIKHGGEIFDASCVACHGVQAEGGVGPALKNRDSAYITKKLNGYSSGKIQTPMASMMSPIASSLSKKDIEDISAYIGTAFKSKLDAVKSGQKNESTGKEDKTVALGDPKAGQELFNSKTCAGCHGMQGEGGVGPKLAGRDASEIVSLFDEYKAGTRDNGMASLMSSVTPNVSEKEIQDIAAYLETLK